MKLNKEQAPLFLSIIAIAISIISCIIAFKNVALQQEEFTSNRELLLTAEFNRGIDIKGTIKYSNEDLNLNPKIRFQPSSDNIKILKIELFYPSKILDNGYDFSKQSSFVLLNPDVWISLEPIITLIKKFHSEIDLIKPSKGVDSEIMVFVKSTYAVRNHQFQQVSIYRIRYVFVQISDPKIKESFNPVICYGFEWIANLGADDFDKTLNSMKSGKDLNFKYMGKN